MASTCRGSASSTQGRAAVGDGLAYLGEQVAVELLGLSRLHHATGGRAAHEPDRKTGRPEDRAGERTRERSGAGGPADHVAVLLSVEVMTGERSAHDHTAGPAMLDEGDLVHPERVPRAFPHVGESVLGTLGRREAQHGDLGAHRDRLTGCARRSARRRRRGSGRGGRQVPPGALSLPCGRASRSRRP